MSGGMYLSQALPDSMCTGTILVGGNQLRFELERAIILVADLYFFPGIDAGSFDIQATLWCDVLVNLLAHVELFRACDYHGLMY